MEGEHSEDFDEDKGSLSSLKVILEALRHYKAMQWKPIDTAPKDGTYILLYRPPYDSRNKNTVHEGKFHKYGATDTWRIRAGQTWYIDVPTHWMPLPKYIENIS